MKSRRRLKWGAIAILVILFACFEFACWTTRNDGGRNIVAGHEQLGQGQNRQSPYHLD
jgi:hypothetical protein